MESPLFSKVFSQAYRHIHALVENAHRTEIAIIWRSEEQVMALVAAKMCLK
ncbi:hypothetical protein ABUK73_23205 [Agrobacterium sp. BA1120]|uniref:hypothetical protein n=1 Tax=Agrobacterium sp. BA1120 TaxID=3228927 RepID=UPI00336A1AFE